MSDQAEAEDKETKELQPIKHDCFRGQRGDKTSFSSAAPYRPLEQRGAGGEGSLRVYRAAAAAWPENNKQPLAHDMMRHSVISRL